MFFCPNIKDGRLVKNVLKTGSKLAESIFKPIINKIFELKEIREVVNDPILDRDEKTEEI